MNKYFIIGFLLALTLSSLIMYELKNPRINCEATYLGMWGIKLEPEVNNLLGESYNRNLTLHYEAFIIRENITISDTIYADKVTERGYMWILNDAFIMNITITADGLEPFHATYYVGDVAQALKELEIIKEDTDDIRDLA